MTTEAIVGQVALIEDDHTLVINRGTEAGVAVGMVFAVSSRTGPVVTDPETGRELGRLSREKLRVRVFDVQPLFARAHTFVMTDDFHGLLQIPFVACDDVITVDVGDAVELVRRDATGHQAGATVG
ncbi:hypothetical protein ORI20_22550 [Mycobacterium sp. CVI_P3]|uniref:DUF192 domain-containing protein n=1 Tax=Mycobacterium pinniadriaticum TaxID=2994102 RepID=A0ABT3SJY9_9MYCO|nr:hypothetical protein [Mycobacterium pinniadriaticum]MCX2933056.1 hypothetical protein [Mycobacterium pinniadriaticum]MCX2939478.1 hypothetical protein [Mycobacterium pinniadriaticum]